MAGRITEKMRVKVAARDAPSGFDLARRQLRPRGTLILKSTFHGAQEIALAPLVVDEITIVGSRCGPFPRAIELLDAGRVQVKPLVAGVYPLAQFTEAFDRAARGLKVILTPGR